MGRVANEYDYDVAVTFAGEDRKYVQDVVKRVADAGYRVFYDQDEQATPWGEELTEYFPKIYEERSRYAVMFVSRYYAAKPWTRLERRSVLLRALEQPTPYLLPVQLDGTKLPGVRSTISYLDGAKMGPLGVAGAICQKLGSGSAMGGGHFNGYVPRNEHEAATLVGERPPGWEYLLFSYSLVRGVENAQGKYLDFGMGYAKPAAFIDDDNVMVAVRRELAIIQSAVRNFNSVLSDQVQWSAFQPQDEPGSIEKILHLASRYVAVYESLIDWAIRLRGYATDSDEAHNVFRALSFYAQQPVERLRSFVYESRAFGDALHSRLAAGENLNAILRIELETPREVRERYNRVLMIFRRTRFIVGESNN